MRGIGFTEQKSCLFSQNSNILEVISGITKPILGIFHCDFKSGNEIPQF